MEYKEFKGKTVEEAVANLLEVAGDYTSIINLHNIEEIVHKRTIAQLEEEINNTVIGFSLTPNIIKLSVDEGSLVVEAFDHKSTTWGSFYDIGTLAPTKEAFIDYLDEAFRSYLNKYVYYSNMKIKDTQRFCNHANLILSSITPETVKNLNRLGKELKKVNKASTDEAEKYSEYSSSLRKAIRNTANLWLDEASIEPNMRLSIKDLRVIEGAASIRTVKKARVSNGELSITFNETKTAIKGKSRIDALESWLLNNPQFLEMSKVLKDPRLDRLYWYFSQRILYIEYTKG